MARRSRQTPYVILGLIAILSVALVGVTGWVLFGKPRGSPVSRALAAPSESTLEARALRDEGFEHLRGGRYAEAIAALQAGHRLRPHPHFLLNVALAFDAWGERCTEVLDATQRFLDACTACPARAEAAPRIAAIHARCAGEVMIDSLPTGASISIDGVARGATPALLHLVPGSHRVRLALIDRAPRDVEIEVERGARRSFTFPIEARAAEPGSTAAPTSSTSAAPPDEP